MASGESSTQFSIGSKSSKGGLDSDDIQTRVDDMASSVTSATEINEQASNVVDQQGKAKKIKRRRGRPKKNFTSKDQETVGVGNCDTDILSNASTTSQCQTESEQSATVSTNKRGRGRPKKVQPLAINARDTEASSIEIPSLVSESNSQSQEINCGDVCNKIEECEHVSAIQADNDISVGQRVDKLILKSEKQTDQDSKEHPDLVLAKQIYDSGRLMLQTEEPTMLGDQATIIADTVDKGGAASTQGDRGEMSDVSRRSEGHSSGSNITPFSCEQPETQSAPKNRSPNRSVKVSLPVYPKIRSWYGMIIRRRKNKRVCWGDQIRSPQKRRNHATAAAKARLHKLHVASQSGLGLPAKSGKCIALEEKVYSMMASYFEAALTILVYRKLLCPKQAFKFENRFGVRVPIFREIPGFPGNQNCEYIQQVSSKMVEFVHKNILEGGVFHVNIKPKKSMVKTIQRYAFQIFGYFGSQECARDPECIKETIDTAYQQFGEALVEILTSDLITELPAPRLSSWKVSLGIKKEYIRMTKKAGLGPMAPFLDDQNSKQFPWGKRPRLSQAKKQSTYFPKHGERPPGFFKNFLKKKAEEKSDSEVLRDCLNEFKEKGKCSTDPFKLDQWQYSSSSSEESEDDDCKGGASNLNKNETSENAKSQDKEYGVMYPISSFAPARGLIISVYRVDYEFEFTKEMIEAANEEDPSESEV